MVIQNKFPVYNILNLPEKSERKLRDNMEVYVELSQYLYASMKNNTNNSYPINQTIIKLFPDPFLVFPNQFLNFCKPNI